ncbi:outer membrane beta-barrel protein [Hymenobacter canadensis]|uniref:Outer membrane beta-barrel protein n=1 Tax=Hymenobacter canadensis TaxID=2999067 RepID=A0ABY7LP72_9BACT|nr:outer membrane beta-barrel protein [Hymenobacter canadensis]WBA41242.1 outer membrane beta-barrel protein [Hymenobacter canadensis]
MKKLATSLLLLGAATAAHAQTSAGTVLLGGNVGYNSSKEKISSGSYAFENSQQAFRIVPTVGYFITDNLALGLAGGIERGKAKSSYKNDDPYATSNQYELTGRSSSTYVGPFVRYYKMVGEKAAFYGQLDASYRKGSAENERITPSSEIEVVKDNNRGFSSNITPGFVFFPTNKLGLELTLGYLGYYRAKTVQEKTDQMQEWRRENSSFGASFGLQYLNIGASFYLGGK